MNIFRNYRIRITGILVITFIRLAFQMSDTVAGIVPFSFGSLLNAIFWAFFTGIITWEASRLAAYYFNKLNPLAKPSARRFWKEALFVMAANTIVYATTVSLFFAFSDEGDPPKRYLLMGLFERFLHGMLVAGFYELLLYAEALRKATQEAEQLKKLNVMVQLESLKNQVKPHFLFNSLNTLTGLVEKNTPGAVKFIAELAKVYRYLLQSNEKELIQLSQELKFAEAYFFLLQTRFGEGITLHQQIEEKYLTWFIPPLTLQLLLENAVKHNQVSVRKPLQVSIRVEANELVVQNNFQPKRSVTTSNGMGLSNIATKYKLLNQPEVVILSEENFFTVKLPLIKPTAV